MKGMCIVNMCSATAQPLDNKSAQKGKEKGEHMNKFIHLVVTWLRCYKVSTTHAGTEKKKLSGRCRNQTVSKQCPNSKVVCHANIS